jgi:acetyltransferase-like isoleucine patch superfamily enzyme
MQSLCETKFKFFGAGADFRPGSYADACSKISIGANVVVRPGSFLFADPSNGGCGITIEDNVLLGPGIHFYANDHSFQNTSLPIIEQGYPEPKVSDSIIIRTGSWIGAGVIILRGVEIGRNSVIGAGTIVTKNVPAGVVFAGNPGKVIREIQV